jgi:hypothetical protein
MKETTDLKERNSKSLLKKLGVAGFIFFLLKGIAWLVFAYWLVN